MSLRRTSQSAQRPLSRPRSRFFSPNPPLRSRRRRRQKAARARHRQPKGLTIRNRDCKPLWVEQLESRYLLSASTGGTGSFLLSDTVELSAAADVALGDVDGDQDLDLVVVTSNSEANQLFLNDGQGNFVESSKSLGSAPGSDVQLSDLDNDGDLDVLILSGSIDSNESIWLNSGAGLFVSAGQSITGTAVELGDLDGDGDIDAYVARRFQPNTIWLNNGAAEFIDSGQTLGDQASYDVGLGDLDGDGDLDAFVANYRDENRVWTNDGSGVFQDSGQLLTGEGSAGDPGSHGVDLGDLDGDGDLDAFVVNGRFGESNRVWLNDGDGAFQAAADTQPLSVSRSVALGDLDGDGDLDTFVGNDGNFGGQSNFSYLNDGTARFTRVDRALGVRQTVVGVALGDLDGDGDLDAVLADSRGSYSGGLTFWTNADTDLVVQSSPLATQVPAGAAETIAWEVVVTNRNGSTIEEVRIVDQFATALSEIHVTEILATGLETASTLTPGPLTEELVDLATIAGNGALVYRLEATLAAPTANAGLVAFHTATATLPAGKQESSPGNNRAQGTNSPGVLVGGTGLLALTEQPFSRNSTTTVEVGDLDADGDLDLFTNQEIRLNDSGGQFVLGQSLLAFSVSDLRLGDLDADGDLDAFLARAGNSNSDLSNRVWLNDGFGTFADSGQMLGNAATAAIDLGDIDGDGDLDVLHDVAEGGLEVWLNDGAANFTLAATLAGQTRATDLRLADLDSDGDLDAFVVHQGQSNRVWRNDGVGGFTDSGQALGTQASQGLALGDIDGDGDLDAAVANFDGNQIWINSGDGTFDTNPIAVGTTSAFGVNLADLDSDGDLDVVLANRTDGRAVWRNLGSGQFVLQPETVNLAEGRDVALGDFDGDGDVDAFFANNGTDRVYLNADSEISVQVSPTSTSISPSESESTSFQVIVTNLSVQPVTGVTVTQALTPALTSPALASVVVSPGATTTLSSGPLNGGLLDTIDLPAGGSVTYELSADVTLLATGGPVAELLHTVSATPPVDLIDFNEANNSARSTNVISLVVGGTGQFFAGQQLPLVAEDLATRLGDLDGDGDLDAFVGNRLGEHRIFLQDEQGNLNQVGDALPRAEIAFSDSTLDVTLADLDGDGDLDAIVTRAGVEFLLNRGNGEFAVSTQRFFGIDTVEPADLDGDGDLDLLTSSYRNTAVDGVINPVLINDGFGWFTTSGQGLTAASQLTGLAAGDLDGDGDIDALATEFNRARVWLNDGSGSFANASPGFNPSRNTGVAVGDLDGDGDLDAVTIADNNGESRVWLNNGNGLFAEGPLLAESNGRALQVELGDLDGDDDLDVVILEQSSNTPIVVGTNDGSAGFTISSVIPSTAQPVHIDLDDLDNDGDLDLFATESFFESSRTNVWLNADTELSITISPPLSEVLAGEAELLEYQLTVTNTSLHPIADVTLSAAFAEALEGAELTAVNSTGGGAGTLAVGPLPQNVLDSLTLPAGAVLTYTVTGVLTPPGGEAGEFVTVVDANVAPPAGIVDGNLANNSAASLNDPPASLAPSTVTFVEAEPVSEDFAASALAVGDFNRDGVDDLLVATNTNSTRIFFSDGAGNLSDSGQVLAGGRTDVASVGDLDGDGDLDAILTDSTASVVWFNDGEGFFTRGGQRLEGRGTDASLADLDGDGDLDFVKATDSTAELWLNDGGGRFLLADELPDSSTNQVDIGDIDGDGDLDLLSASRSQVTQLWLNDGAAQFTLSTNTIGVSRALDGVLVDLDGDDDLDAVLAGGTGPSAVWLNDGTGLFQQSAEAIRINALELEAADIDGDGDSDIFYASRSASIFESRRNFLLINQGDGSFVESNQFLGDNAAADFVLGDFDSDRDLDLVIGLPSAASDVELYVNADTDLAIQTLPTNIDAAAGSVSPITYSLVVTNLGPRTVVDASVVDLFGDELSDVMLTDVTGASGALTTLSPGPLGEQLADTVTLPAGASLTYTIEATFSAPTEQQTLETHVATVTTPAGILESTLANNSSRSFFTVPAVTAVSTAQFVPTEQELRTDGEDVALGDLDGDGDLDALVASDGRNGHAVLINQGEGVFEEVQRLGARLATTVELGDIDGDGDLDAITVRFNASSQTWLNDGSGRFVEGDPLFVTMNIANLVLSDLDGDGDLDLFGARSNLEENVVLLNNGFGRFVDSGQRLGANNSQDVAVADIDGDGDLDAVVANDGANRIWLNDGTGAFSDSGMRLGGATSHSVVVGDFNGSGELDILFGNRFEPSALWVSSGTGFSRRELPRGASNDYDLKVADLDGDGDLDALVVGSDRVLLNDGAGNFSAAQPQLFDRHQSVALGDLDGDGDVDAYFTRGNGGFDAVWLNADNDLRLRFLDQPATNTVSAGQLLTYRFEVENVGPNAVADAALRIAVPAPLTAASLVSITPSPDASSALPATPIAVGSEITDTISLEIGATITYELTVEVAESADPNQQTDALATFTAEAILPGTARDATDFDNLLVDSNQVLAVATAGSGLLVDSGQRLGEGGTYAVALGDLDGDGDLDAVVSNSDAATGNRIWLNDGSGALTPGATLSNYQSTSLALGDIDGDGDLDVLLGFRSYGTAPSTLFLNDGSGAFTPSGQVFPNRGTLQVSLADLDGDGDVDATIDGQIYSNDGTGRFVDSGQSLAADRSFIPSYGDVDGDGDLDVLFGNRLEINQGDGSFEENSQRLGSLSTVSSVLRDLNGDGHLDAFLPVEGGNTVWINDGMGAFSDSGQLFGNPGADRVSLGDLDGDGDVDAVVYNYVRFGPQQRLEIWLNDGDGNFFTNGQRLDAFGVRAGALGDLDGDGDLDAFFANREGPDSVWRNPSATELIDLGVTKSNGLVEVTQGGELTYVITVTNEGAIDAIGAQLRDTLPRELNNLELVSIETSGGSNSSLTSGSVAAGADVLTDVIDLPAGATIRYEISGQVTAADELNTATRFWLSNSVEVIPPIGFVDPFVANNLAVDADIVTLLATGGSGTFARSEQTLPSGDANDLVLGDLDGDGDLDAIVIYQDAADQVLLNDGEGSYVVSSTIVLEGSNHTLAAALGDVDNDGDLDVIVNRNQSARLWLNEGDGSFIDSGQRIGTSSNDQAGFATLIDLNADGNLDLIVGNAVHLGDGTGNLVEQSVFIQGGINTTALGDLDGDGDLDALGGRTLLLNDGSGKLESVGDIFDNRYTPWSLGDLDGDGDLDAVRGTSSAQQIWLNNGAANFTLQTTLPGGTGAEQVELADVDGDRDLDVIVKERLNNIRVWINDGSANFSDIGSRFALEEATRFALGDVNGDGTLDAFVVHANQLSAVWLNQQADVLVDLAIEKSAGQTAVRQGDTLTYTITVSNNGTSDVSGATVTDTFSASLTDVVLVSVVGQAGGISSLIPGTFPSTFTDTIDLPAGALITYTVEATVPRAGLSGESAQFIFSNAAKVELPSGPVGDSNLSNNVAIDADVLVLAAEGGTADFFDSGFDFLLPGQPAYNNRDVALGDLDGDGDLDAFLANEGGSSQLSPSNRVLLNDGTGRLVDSGQSLGQHRTDAVELADIDGDGDLDALTVNRYLNTTEIWRNNGQGVFVSAGPIDAISVRPSELAVGDLDGDGSPDVVVSSFPDERSFVLLNDGQGNFNETGQQIEGRAEDVELGDLDGDGDLDMFLAIRDRPNRVWLNLGDSTFAMSEQEIGQLGSFDVTLGDVDGDGDLDAFVVDYSRDGTKVWINNGEAQFADNGQDLSAFRDSEVVLGDLDGDGDLDALTASRFRQGLQQTFINDGTGQFTPGSDFETFRDTLAVALGDLDQDGDLDAVLGAFQGVAVVFNGDVDLQADLESPVTTVSPGEVVPYTLTVTNNGSIEVLGAQVETLIQGDFADLSLESTELLRGAASTSVLINQATGSLADVVNLPVGASIVYHFSATVAASQGTNAIAETHFSAIAAITTPAGLFDADPQNNRSRQDELLVISAPQPGGVYVDSGQLLGAANSRDVKLGDLDGDGDLDAIVATATGAAVWINEAGLFAAGPVLGELDALSVGLGDLDDDGDLDVIIGTNRMGNRVWLNSGQATFVDTGQQLDDESTTTIGIADFDGDGDLDFLGGNNGRGDILWLNDGSGTFTSTEGPRDYSIAQLALGDLDGDGDLDVLSSFTNGDSDGSVRVRFSNGDGTLSDPTSLNDFSGASNVALGDLDGDGDLDAFVTLGVEGNTRSDGRSNRILLNDGSGTFSDGGQRLGMANSRDVSLGDVDNDGDIDAVVVNVGRPNQLWVNDGTGSFTQRGPEFGDDASAAVALGDLDSDGDLDLFVANQNGPNRIYTSLDPRELTDLSITKTAGQVAALQGSPITYTIVASNLGPQSVTGASVVDTWSSTLSDVRLESISGTGGAASTLLPGSLTGQLVDMVNLPVGATITYVVSATAAAQPQNFAPESVVSNTARIELPPSFEIDLNPLNNFAVDSDLVVLPSGAGLGSFQITALMGLDSSITDIALGDLDGDGDLDAFVTRTRPTFSDGQEVNQVWWNDGRGNFVDSGQSLGRERSFSVKLGDLDNDGDLDAFEGAEGGNRIWLNNGQGFFAVTDQVLGDVVTLGVALADLDADGDLDAFTANRGFFGRAAPDVVWLNDGAANFTEGFTTQQFTSSRSVELGDLEGDGDLDVIIGTFSEALVLLNDGFGSFQVMDDRFVADLEGGTLVVGDVNGDGALDVLANVETFVPGTGRGGGSVIEQTQVLLNVGKGQFELATTFSAGNVSDYALTDFDGDGDLDAVTTHFYSSGNQAAQIWLNDGAGVFSRGQAALSTSAGSLAIAVGDLDGDGDPDLLTDDYGRSTRRWLNLNSADLSVDVSSESTSIGLGEANRFTIRVTNNGETPTVDAVVSSILAPVLIDAAVVGIEISGDATSSIGIGPVGSQFTAIVGLTPGASISYTIEAALNPAENTNRTSDAQLTLTATVTPRTAETETNSADNTDRNFQTIELAAGAGHAEFLNSGQTLGTGVSTDVAYGDLDGDGDLDAFVARRLAGNLVWENRGGGVFVDTQQSLGSGDSRAVALGDFNSDGALDAVVINRFGSINVWQNNRQGGFTLRAALGENLDYRDVAVADFNADGRPDLLVTASSGNQVWLGQRAGMFSSAGAQWGGLDGQAVAVGDVDGDGDVDAVIVKSLGNANQLWLNDGNANFIESGRQLSAHDGTAAKFADLDQDGDLDLFVTNRESGNEVWLNDAAGNFIQTAQALGSGRSVDVALGDIDGDGDQDAIVANNGGQPNQLWLGDGTGLFVAADVPIGNDSTLAVALGDADGDGDLDLLMASSFGPGNQFWRNHPFNLAAGDFDSNGRTDSQDLRQWQAEFGLGNGADADGDGDTDGADFLAWQRGFALPQEASLTANEASSDGADFLSWQQGFGITTNAIDLASWASAYGSSTGQTASESLLEDKPQQSLAATSPTGTSLSTQGALIADVVDAALTLDRLEEDQEVETEQLLLDQQIVANAASSSFSAPALAAATPRRAEIEPQKETRTADHQQTDIYWLTDKLLERIFG